MFKNKNILITGASSGIGLNLAKYFFKKNSNLILISKDKKKLEFIKNNISKKISPIFFDFTQFHKYESLFNTINKRYGKVDFIVHAAGVHAIDPIKITTHSNISNSIDLNLKSAVLISKYASNGIYMSRPSSIIFISSVMSVIGEPGQVLYSASKSGLIGLTKSLAVELSRYKIRVNCLSPASIDSPMLKRYLNKISDNKKSEILKKHLLGIGRYQDINYLVEFLLSKKSRWITGQNIIIDGGYSL
tara:strand:- start:600 stop:1337 length:738 start_codon:yes stop_codon:yes gene_type:complete